MAEIEYEDDEEDKTSEEELDFDDIKPMVNDIKKSKATNKKNVSEKEEVEPEPIKEQAQEVTLEQYLISEIESLKERITKIESNLYRQI